jgi:hypothetical protein
MVLSVRMGAATYPVNEGFAAGQVSVESQRSPVHRKNVYHIRCSDRVANEEAREWNAQGHPSCATAAHSCHHISGNAVGAFRQLFGYVSHSASRDPAAGTTVPRGPGVRATQPAPRIISSKLMKHASEALSACNSERAPKDIADHSP